MRMMDLVADTRRIAYGSMADQLNFLEADVPLGDATLPMVLDVSNLQPGMVLSCNLNVYYVVSTDPASKRVFVYASYDNSPNDALPAGAPVMIRPRVTDWVLFNALNSSIRQMSSRTSGLYRKDSWEDVATTMWQTFTIPDEASDMQSLLGVYRQRNYGDDGWYRIRDNLVKVDRTAGLIVLNDECQMFGRAVRFDYRAPFKTAESLTDDLEVDLGLSASMLDIPPLGAAATLLRTTESRRNQTHAQGDPRRAEEVPTSSNSSVARELRRQFEDRIRDEAATLINVDPIVRVVG